MTLDELDRLAAEKIMGWRPVFERINEDEFATWEEPIYYLNELGREINYWQPTMDIAQAWECLERCEKHAFDMHGNVFPNGEIRGYGVKLSLAAERVWANTAPEAIVRACLKARGVAL